MNRKRLAFSCLLAVAASGANAHAGTMINASDRGWFSDNGVHNKDNLNTFTGQEDYDATDSNNVIVNVNGILRSFFVFDTNSLVGSTVTSVDLLLELEAYFNVELSETFDVFDVSTPASAFDTSYSSVFGNLGDGMSIYADLGTGSTGSPYATRTVVEANENSVLTISLSAQAVSDLNAAIASSTEFIVGLSVHGPFTVDSSHEALRFSNGSEHRTHAINVQAVNTVPEPASLAIFGALGVAAAGVRRRKQK